MNKVLRAQELDPYTTIFESGNVKRNVSTLRAHRALKSAAVCLVEQTLSYDSSTTFDAKQNLRNVRSFVTTSGVGIDSDLLKMAEGALIRQDSMLSAGKLDFQVEILASDLAKLFD